MRGQIVRWVGGRGLRSGKLRRGAAIRVEPLESRTFLSAGDLDPTFGTGGLVTTDFAGSAADRPRQIALQDDGKLLEVAWHSGFGVGEPQLAVSRFNADGTLDTSFGDAGLRVVDFPGRGEFFGSIALAPSGKIAVGTWTFFPTTDILGADSDASVALLNPDGSFDTGFDGDGMRVFDFGQAAGGASAPKTTDIVFDIAVQPDGKIVTAGAITLSNQGRVALARLNVDGSLETSFGTGGVVTTPFANYSGASANAVTVDDQGRIVAAGTAGIPGSNGRVTDFDFFVARYTPNGALDTSFDGDGFAVTPFSTSSETVNGVATAPGGKIVVAGGTFGGASGDIAVARYNDDGSPDAGFSGDGKATVGLTAVNTSGQPVATNESAAGLAVQSDGAILLSGRNSAGAGVTLVAETFIVRLDGKAVSADLDDGPGVVVPGDDSYVILGGVMTTPTGGFEDFAASRFDSSGNLDTSYGNNGVAVADFIGSGFSQASAAAVQDDGKIVAGGLTIVSNANLRDLAFARYNPDGSLDPAFGNGGHVQVDLGTPGVNTERVSALALDAQGRIVFAGAITDPATKTDNMLVGRGRDPV